jgi:hypothetical protein
MIIMFAIVTASCIFGLNQIIIMSDDVKLIKSIVKDMKSDEKTVVDQEVSTS